MLIEKENSVTNLAIKLPIWLTTYSLLVIPALLSFPSHAGIGAESTPAVISEKVDQSKNEDHLNAIKEKDKQINELNGTLTKLKEFTIHEISIREKQIKELEDKNLALSQKTGNTKEQNSNVSNETPQLKAAPDQPRKVNDSYILPLRKFHQEARCYGSSLNFTVGEAKPECIPKEELATRFLEFLVELDLYDKEKPKTLEIAKKELIKLQKKYKFSKPGWYGIHMFNILATELRTKALSAK